MSLLVVGSIALDTIETPYGKRKSIPGGSAIYFSYSANAFSKVRLVGVVGNDFPPEELVSLKVRSIDLTGISIQKGKTFAWHGRYLGPMATAQTVSVHLNTFGTFEPKIPVSYRNSRYIFLANGSPRLQKKVLNQLNRPKFVLADTMDFWIKHEKKALLNLIEQIDGLIINNDEVRQLTGIYHLVTAAREIMKWGPKFLIIKKGEYGAVLITKNDFFAVPGYPVAVVKDPTGAGDSFAGGLMGYLAQTDNLSLRNLKKSLLFGTTLASFTIEDFGLERLKQINRQKIRKRYQALLHMISI